MLKKYIKEKPPLLMINFVIWSFDSIGFDSMNFKGWSLMSACSHLDVCFDCVFLTGWDHGVSDSY